MNKGDKFIYNPSDEWKSYVGEYSKYFGQEVEVTSDDNVRYVDVRAQDGNCWCTSADFLKPIPKVKLASFPYTYGKIDWNNMVLATSEAAAKEVDKLAAQTINDGIDALKYAGGSLDHTPDHYTVGGIDVWEYAELKFSHEANVGFHIINTIKYATRYEHKNGLDDLIKARDSINKAIELLEKQQPKKNVE